MNYTGKKFSLWTDYGALNSRVVFDAFRSGLLRSGFSVNDNDPTADVDVIWSVLWHGRMAKNKGIWERAKAQKKPVIVLEVGGIARGHTWKVGLNGVNGKAYFGPGGNDSTRAEHLELRLSPWKKPQGDILVCCQHSKSAQWEGMPAPEDWVNSVVQEIRQHTDRTIRVRPHPRCPLNTRKIDSTVVIESPKKLTQTYDSYDLQFNNAYAVVNWSSNPGVQAVIAGVAAFTGPDSLARPVANLDLADINDPCQPDRQQWLNDYAHTEFTLSEIEQGLPIALLTNKLI